MDAVTSFVLTTVLSLLNGAVLGFMHRDLPEQLRPSAQSWRIGTLLAAGGALLLGLQRFMPLALVLPIGNAALVVGLNQYWRALRSFTGQRAVQWAWVLPTIVVVAIWWFVVMQPSLSARVVISSVAWLISIGGSAMTLLRIRPEDDSRSRRVLLAVLVLLAMVMLSRALYFTFGSPNEQTIVDPGSWVNGLTPMLVGALPIIGTTAFLLMCSDRLRQQWERAASTDHLTGLSNRRTLSDVGAERVSQAKRLKRSLSVALIDLDHFKSVNDRFGHAVGDLALQHVATTLRAVCRREDLVSRQGGEEFVVVFDRLDLPAAMQAADRLRAAIERAPVAYQGGTLPITASMGVATLNANDVTLDDVVSRADQALYRAKQGGRNRVES